MMPINYVDDMMKEKSNGLNKELCQLLDDDIKFLSNLGVKNDKQRNLAFYLDNFCEDICKEFGANIESKDKIISGAYNYLKDLEDIDLDKIRAAFLKTIRNIEKKAYPNTMGVNETNKKPKRDIDKWIKTLGQIYEAMRRGEDRESVMKRLTEEWNPMEKYDFEAWARYYEKDNHEKYNIKKAEFDPQILREYLEEKPVEKTPKEKDMSDYKKSLLGRLNSAERLLNNFVHVWPDDIVKRLYDGLYELKRQIITMKTATSVQDVIIRTAGIWERTGFPEGANELRKMAQPPDDITTEIEKALTGREFEKSPKEKIPEEMPDLGGMPDMPEAMEEMPDLGESDKEFKSDKEPESAIPAGVEEELPSPIETEIPEPPKPKQNPYEGSSIKDVLDILEPLTQSLRERDFIRDLSKADMMMDALNIASHFPELGEVLAKALELNIYMGTRLEKVISKLKGGVKEKEEIIPNIEMEELSKPEETAFEVVEEEPKSKVPQKRPEL